MKLAYLSAVYPEYARDFYSRHPALAMADFDTQRQALERDAFAWAGAWGPALAGHGIEVRELWINLEPLQRAWAREHGPEGVGVSLDDVAIAQLAAFAPDVLWFDHKDASLLARARAACPSIRAALGWVGSALPETPIWRAFDRVLSCDQGSVEALEAGGARAALLHHAFPEPVLARLEQRPPTLSASFVGQFDPAAPGHALREQVLESLLASQPISIFAPRPTRPSPAKLLAKRAAWLAAGTLRRVRLGEAALRRLPVLGSAAGWSAPPRGALPARLAAATQPPRFGLAMFQTLSDSKVALNVQGVARDRPASNMRLFEATGVGTCLLTDAAGRLGGLFEPDREVAIFRTAAECHDKLCWLLDHEDERAAMARAGQARCLAEHTFRHRAPRLVELIRAMLG